MANHQIYYGFIGHLEQRIIEEKEILSESNNYILHYQCESVYLNIKNKEIPTILIGHHYGNPNDGLISRNEDYVVSVGCGINLAFLNNIYNNENHYYCEYEEFLNAADTYWHVDEVFQIDEEPNEIFRFKCCNKEYDLAEYSFNTISKEITLCKVIEELPDKKDL